VKKISLPAWKPARTITLPSHSSTMKLRLRLRAGKRIIKLHNELLAARDSFQIKASHDSLTGLWNHEEILLILAQELSRAEREEKCVGVIMADIDFFKKINDSCGHMVGDAVIRSVANKMSSLMPSLFFEYTKNSYTVESRRMKYMQR